MAQRTDPEAPTRLCILGLSFAVFAFSEAAAQELAPAPPKQRGAFMVPMLTVAEALDDNILFTQFPESDRVTRVTLGAETGYRSTPFTIDLQAARSADFFELHPEFNTGRGRTVAQLATTALPTRSLTLSMFACYLDTMTPSELNLNSGLTVGRSLATRVSAAPAFEYRLGSRSSMTGAFPVAHDTIDGRIADTMTGVAELSRRITRRDGLSLRYEHRWFHFYGGPRTERSTADVVMLGWLGEVSDRTILLLRAGPRYAKGAFTAEILATMKRRINRGLLTLTYSKSQSTTLGKTGALDTQSVVGTLAMRVTRNIEIASGPGIYYNSLRGQRLAAMRLNVESLWHFADWFHLGAAYSFDLQQPDFGAPGHIRRGALVLKLVTSKPQRRPEGPTGEEPMSEMH